MAVTAFYLAFGAGVLESAFWFYALNAALAAAGMVMAFSAVARLRHAPAGRRALPALIFMTPGTICGTTTLINFPDLCAGAQPESVGRYGAFLVFAYALLIAAALKPSRAQTAQ